MPVASVVPLLSFDCCSFLRPAAGAGTKDLARTEQAGACGWALNEGFKSGTISLREKNPPSNERLTFYHNGLERRLTNVHGEVVKDILA